MTPIREVDDHEIGPPGPVTKELQTAYLDTVPRQERALGAVARVREIEADAAEA